MTSLGYRLDFAASDGLQIQVKYRVEMASQVEGRGSEETVLGGALVAASANIRILRSLKKSSRQQVVQLPSRRKPTTSFKVVPKSKQRSSAMEVVIPKVSKRAQKTLLGLQQQRDRVGRHCQVCQDLEASRWRL